MQDILVNQSSRINFYALISRLLMLEVDKELLNTIQNDPNILAFFPNFEKWDKRKQLSQEDLLNQYLNVDFTNLFLLHMVPYESFYTREDQMMETGGENPVLQFFNRYDFRVDMEKARTVSVDHIGIEMEFMYKLCEAEYEALLDGDKEAACEIAKVQKEFLQKHLLVWAPMFLLNMRSESGTALYFDLAELALEFILSDYEYLNRLISEDGCKYEE
jgi:TorA maturation chaperone TorD